MEGMVQRVESEMRERPRWKRRQKNQGEVIKSKRKQDKRAEMQKGILSVVEGRRRGDVWVGGWGCRG